MQEENGGSKKKYTCIVCNIITHRMSSPLVTVLRRRVPKPESIPENPPILGPKKVSNKSNGFVCKIGVQVCNLNF